MTTTQMPGPERQASGVVHGLGEQGLVLAAPGQLACGRATTPLLTTQPDLPVKVVTWRRQRPLRHSFHRTVELSWNSSHLPRAPRMEAEQMAGDE